MKSRTWWWVAAVGLIGVACWVSSADAAPRERAEKANVEEVIGIIEADCNLTDEQKEKIGKLKEERDKKVADRQEKIDKARQKLASIKEKRQRERAEQEIKLAEKQMETYGQLWDPKAIGLLKPEQKQVLFAKLVDNRVKDEFKGFSWTEDQSTKVKDLSEKAAKKLAAGGTFTNAQMNSIYKEIMMSVMAPDQRKDYIADKQKELKQQRR